MTNNDGIGCQRSEVTAADVTDGTSTTYMLGEKYHNPDNYVTGLDYGDDHSIFAADDYDRFCWAIRRYQDAQPANNPPMQDRAALAISGGGAAPIPTPSTWPCATVDPSDQLQHRSQRASRSCQPQRRSRQLSSRSSNACKSSRMPPSDIRRSGLVLRAGTAPSDAKGLCTTALGILVTAGHVLCDGHAQTSRATGWQLYFADEFNGNSLDTVQVELQLPLGRHTSRRLL